MTPAPAVSVILAAHDHAATLPAAIDSILGQSFRDLELIAIDDGSTDATPMILDDRARDHRVRIVRNERRLGLPRSLNRGLELARAPLVARMDGDDRSAPERLARQIAFLDAHPEIGLLGAQPRLVDRLGRPLPRRSWRVPIAHDAIVWRLLTGNPFVHPSIVARTELLHAAGGYDPAFPRGQDFALWTRLVFTTRCANLDERLIDYRVPDGPFETWQTAMDPLIERIAHGYMERILARPVDVDLATLIARLDRGGVSPATPTDRLIEASLLLTELHEAMSRCGLLTQGDDGPAHLRMQAQVQRLIGLTRTAGIV
jgi:glycosyltransferase involved in cell wall biosynthesis